MEGATAPGPELTLAEQMSTRMYMGTKKVLAIPMTKENYCKYRGWDVPANEDPTEIVYMVEYEPDGTESNMADKGHKGHVSMSPRLVFDVAYRENGRLDFGSAIVAVKQGKRIQRIGWNGSGMFVFRQVPAEIGRDIIPKMQSLPDSVKEALLQRSAESINYSNQLALVKPDNTINGWAPSSADTLAEDWYIFP